MGGDVTTPYQQAIQELDDLREERRLEGERHEAESRRLQSGIDHALSVIALAERYGTELAEMHEVAVKILRVEWHRAYNHSPEVASCFANAVDDIRRNAPRLRRGYFGVKQYDVWTSQRTDCEYGMGPSHGSIWFRIGLVNARGQADLTDVERVACVRYLLAVQADPAALLGGA